MSLIAHYKLDGNALDSSGNGYHGTATGTYEAGKLSNCIHTTTNINTPVSLTNTLHYNEQSVSFGGWFKFNETEVLAKINEVLASSEWENPTGNLLGYNSYGGMAITWQSTDPATMPKVWVSARTPSTQPGTSSYTVQSDTWVHFFMTWDRQNNLLSFYANGDRVGSAISFTATDLPSRGFLINGGGIWGGDGPSLSLPLYIDDVRIYNHALSEKEIKELAKAKVLHYTFDDFQEPTENIASESFGFATMGRGGISYSFVGIEDGWRKYSITGTGSSDTYPYTFNITPSTILLSQRTSFSWKFKTNVESKYVNWGGFYMVNIAYASGMASSSTIVGDYRIGKFENVSPASGSEIQSQSIYFNSRPVEGVVFNPLTDFIYFKDVQAERKPYATPYVQGIRTGSVSDSSGYDNHADLALATTPQWTSDSRIGSGAYRFDGSQYFYVTPYPKNTQEQTVSFWAYALDWQLTSSRSFLSCTEGGGWNVWLSGYVVYIEWYIAGAYRTANFSKTGISAGWHMISISYDGQYLKSYLDGEIKTTTSITGTIQYTKNKLYIGAENNNDVNGVNPFSGYIDDVRIYATALSADDIKELYQTRAFLDSRGNFFAGGFTAHIDAPIDNILIGEGMPLESSFLITDIHGGI